jgi:hypothetical protein
LKEPQWQWEIPVYFFVGGAAGAAAVVGALAHWTGADVKIVRDARLIAASGAVLSGALLVADLGKPERFLNMLRVFKWQSPMSMGAWVLTAFGTSAGAAAFAHFLREHSDSGVVRHVEKVSEASAALFGLPFSNYTGVLIGASVIPVWNHFVKELPLHFGMSGLNSAVALLELTGNASPALNHLGLGAAAMETYLSIRTEMLHPRVSRPLKEGASGWMTRTGGLLSGPLPVLLRAGARFSGKGRSRKLRRWAAWSSIAGSLLTRSGWLQAGHASAKDWRYSLGIPESNAVKIPAEATPPEHLLHGGS